MSNRGSALTVKTLSAPFEGARFGPTFFSIIAIGMLVVGLPVMAATATNLGASLSTDIIDAAQGRESEGDINAIPPSSTGYDLINSPYTATYPNAPYTNAYTSLGISPLISTDLVNSGAVGTFTVEPNQGATLQSCVPKQLMIGPVYGGSSIIAGTQEIAYNISKGDEADKNDFRVARSLQVEANLDLAYKYPSCISYECDCN